MCNYCVRLHHSSTRLEAPKFDNGYTLGSILLTIVFLKSMMKYLYNRKEGVGRMEWKRLACYGLQKLRAVILSLRHLYYVLLKNHLFVYVRLNFPI